jgi:isopenicillin N synthase-like dioxygenase
MNTGALPIIDLSGCLSGSAADRKKAADAIRRACEEIGFFLVRGHGVEDTLKISRCSG